MVASSPPSIPHTSTTEATKKKKGFKKCNSLALPKGMEKLMETIRAPMQDMKSMMTEDQEAVVEDHTAQQQFHNVGF